MPRPIFTASPEEISKADFELFQPEMVHIATINNYETDQLVSIYQNYKSKRVYIVRVTHKVNTTYERVELHKQETW